MEGGNLLFFSPVGGGGGGSGGDGGGGDPNAATHVVYEHPNHGTVHLPVMLHMDGEAHRNVAFNLGSQVRFKLSETIASDGKVFLAAYDVEVI